MSPLVISILGLAGFLLLVVLGMPIAFSFAIAGFIGLCLIRDPGAGLSILGSGPYTWASMEALICLPLFVLMGFFAYHCGISKELYVTANKWVGRLPGGLAMATVLACTGFAACTGSSMAGAATMGTIAYPEMEGVNYNRRLSTGCIAAGGTLGILIPPSSIFIMYGFLTETSIGALFVAGIIPGLLLSGLFIAVILVLCKRNPQLGPAGQSFRLIEMISSLRGIWPTLVLFILVIGGLFFGIFTPSEAGAVGAFGAFAIALAQRRLTFATFTSALKDTTRITCFVLTITIGAMIFNTFLAVSGFTTTFSDLIANLPVSPYIVLIIILLVYIILGCIMDSMAITLLTIPVVFPIIAKLGFDLVWFGVLFVVMTESALITPPIGMNVYIVQGVTKVPLQDVFRGIIPFFIMMILCVAVLIAFPQISLFLPNLMK
jgi:tripartite ATP-independent transporter DctM subunit